LSQDESFTFFTPTLHTQNDAPFTQPQPRIAFESTLLSGILHRGKKKQEYLITQVVQEALLSLLAPISVSADKIRNRRFERDDSSSSQR
jgi:hypothetical protein